MIAGIAVIARNPTPESQNRAFRGPRESPESERQKTMNHRGHEGNLVIRKKQSLPVMNADERRDRKGKPTTEARRKDRMIRILTDPKIVPRSRGRLRSTMILFISCIVKLF